MARKKAARKKGVRRRPSGRSKPLLRRLVTWALLALLLLCSLGLTVYVLFFHVPAARAETVLARAVAGQADGAGSARPKAAIIIDDMGHYLRLGRALLALDLELAYSFLPQARYTPELMAQAHGQGRVVLLHQAMEPRGHGHDPGPAALLIRDGVAKQEEILIRNLLAVSHAVGVNNHMGSRYMADELVMERFMLLLRRQGLFFVDSLTGNDSVAADMALLQGVPLLARDVFLDHERDPEAVCAQLGELARIAEQRGWALGIGHPDQATVAGLRQCGEEFLRRVELVGVTELLGLVAAEK